VRVDDPSLAARARPRGKAPPLKVACVGHAALDHVFNIDAMPVEPTKTLARRYGARPGGMSLHAAIAAARLGATARLLGRVGEDASADFLRQRLAAEGVQAEGLETVRGASTSLAAVIVDAGGARQIYIHRGDALTRAHALDTRQLEGADVVMADTRWPEGAAVALQWARAHGVPSLLDGDVAPADVLERLVPLARWVAFSEPGCDQWAAGRSRDAALADALARGCELALVTLGPDGARWAERGRAIQQVSAPAVQALDTTAAGDVFHAALAVALGEGQGTAQAVAWACAAAAFKCERGGGAEGAPTRGELSRWLAQRATLRTPGTAADG
jgi:sulfofructose kinase